MSASGPGMTAQVSSPNTAATAAAISPMPTRRGPPALRAVPLVMTIVRLER